MAATSRSAALRPTTVATVPAGQPVSCELRYSVMHVLPIAALGLLVLSGWLLDVHRRTWRAAERNPDLDHRERRSARAQYLRRIRASGLIGLIGGLLMLRPLVPEEPLWYLLYLLLLVLLCASLLLLAMVDALAGSFRVRRSRHDLAEARKKLEAEIQAFRRRSK